MLPLLAGLILGAMALPDRAMPSEHGLPCSSGVPKNSRWARVKAIFLSVLDIPDADRPKFLADACGGDADVEREVVSLLAHDVEAGSFCETPAAGLLGVGALPPVAAPVRLPAGSRLGVYEVTGFIAAGGMGEVYCARDTQLGREVAIKRVGAEFANPQATARLIGEARHASSLKHPNICTIHEVGTAEGRPFIVMELIDGRPLSEVLREGRPTLGVALRYGIEVADALDHAHGRGVVHRDLKSSNIVIDRSGKPIVLDFGLAKRLLKSGEPQTVESNVGNHHTPAGTLSHMAPEVLLGGRADARTDVWAIGVLLYELATGGLPFTGRTPFETSAAILGEPPRPMEPRVPLALRLVIERCLVKNPGNRYQRASDVRAALERIEGTQSWPIVWRLLIQGRPRALQITAGVALLVLSALSVTGLRRHLDAAAPHVSTFAVLPLANDAGNAADEVFVAGMTDALTAQLGAIGTVRVISRSSAIHAVASGQTVPEIGRALGADAVLRGTVGRLSNRIRLSLRLTEAATGRVIWSDDFERHAREVLVLQADAVRALAFGIRAGLRPDVRERLTMVRAIGPDVYEAYVKGRYAYDQRTPDSLQVAVKEFTRALELDPTYAPAYAALANCYNQLGTVLVGSGSPREYRPRAAAAAIKALQIDPNSAEAHTALGFVRHYEWQWRDAEQELTRAIELNPNYALAHVYYANLLMSLRRSDESLREILAAKDLDPFSLDVNANLGWMLASAGRYDEAIEHLKRTVALDSSYPHARTRLAEALNSAGRYDEALSQVNEAVRLTNRSPSALGQLAKTYALLGRTAEARAVLDEVLALARHQYVPPASLFLLYQALGETETALDWLERSYDERSNFMAYIASQNELRSNARFQRMLRLVGLN